jgi:hypothetical protein
MKKIFYRRKYSTIQKFGASPIFELPNGAVSSGSTAIAVLNPTGLLNSITADASPLYGGRGVAMLQVPGIYHLLLEGKNGKRLVVKVAVE